MKSVAIVGFYGPTMPALEQSTADEVWVPNHGMMVMAGDYPRIANANRLFEIHKEYWYKRKELPKFMEYWDWLRQDRGIPIYMQPPVNPEVVNGVEYPYEEVCADVFAHLWHMQENRELVNTKYMTSSASFMVALAIHEKFERIEIYGIEMSTDTEYSYQLPGVTYLLGVAGGRGIDHVLQHNSRVCNQAVYAYDAVPHISKERLEELRKHYMGIAKTKGGIAKAKIADANLGTADKDEALRASDFANAYMGSVGMIEQIIKTGSEYHSRQGLEVKRRNFVGFVEEHKSFVNALHGQFELLMANGRHSEAETVWKEYIDKRAAMYANAGGVALLDNLIAECDLNRPKHELVLTIGDKPPSNAAPSNGKNGEKHA